MLPFEAYRGSSQRRPPTPPTGPPPPPAPPPSIHIEPRRQTPRGPEPAEVGLLKLASGAGELQDVHQILTQYILAQTPDPTTGRLRLYLFYESIREAIYNNHPTILSYLLFMRVGEPKLHVFPALETRSSSIFQVFLDYGWNINEPLERTMAPALGYISDDKVLTEWFLDHGADPNATCAWDFTPMSEAMYRAPLDVIKMLFKRGGDVKQGQLLHNAVLREGPDNLELVSLLIDMGLSVNDIQYANHPQAFGERYAFALGTPLHYAAEENRLALVSFLLKKGADPFIKNTKGRTVLETAEFLQKSEVVSILNGSAP